MSDSSVNPIKRVSLADGNTQISYQADPHEPARMEHDPNRKAETVKDQAGNLTNISIHFDVDEETKRLMVIVVNRESGKVIRTIPASEFQKLKAGELLKLTA